MDNQRWRGEVLYNYHGGELNSIGPRGLIGDVNQPENAPALARANEARKPMPLDHLPSLGPNEIFLTLRIKYDTPERVEKMRELK